MSIRSRACLIGCTLGLLAGVVSAQPGGTPTPTPPGLPGPTPVGPPPSRDLIAARVNGQAILELAIFRSQMNVPKDRQAQARPEILKFHIDNAIVDQYLLQLKIQVEPKEVEAMMVKLKEGKDRPQWEAVLKQLMITEDEMRSELTAALRWDKFVLQQGTDKVLRDLFDKNLDMFNGSQVRARHILIAVKDGQKEPALNELVAIKKGIEAEVGQAVAKLPATADALTLEKTRAQALEGAFSQAAMKRSSCPSSKHGGDLEYFRRVGEMVEPFARAAFALKPYQMSEPVASEFGYHLILAVDHKPGKEVKFEDERVKRFVQEIYGERLREAILGHYRAKSKIEILEKK
jgi:parvulin-like peptidyl-prolyl isomerase